MTVEGLLAESNAINNFRFRQVEKFPHGAGDKLKGVQNSAPVSVSAPQDIKCDDSIVSDIVKARQKIQLSLASGGDGGSRASEERVQKLESRVADLEEVVKKLTSLIEKLNVGQSSQPTSAPAKVAAPARAKPKATPAQDDDDDVDLFGSDDEVDEEAEKLKQERVAAYTAKKSKKPALVAKSSVILDVKPWDDETNMEELQAKVRTIEMDGLVWGASKFVPLAYGIKKLQIVCVIEDDKVSIDLLTEKIEEFEDYVQSTDIAAFNKV